MECKNYTSTGYVNILDLPSRVEKIGNREMNVEKIILNLGTEENRRSSLNVRINRMILTTLVSMIVSCDNSVVA